MTYNPKLFGPWPLTIYHLKVRERWQSIGRAAQRANDGLSVAVAEATLRLNYKHLLDSQRETRISCIALVASIAVMCACWVLYPILTRHSGTLLLCNFISTFSTVITVLWIKHNWKIGREKLATLDLPEERIDPI